MFVAFSFLYIFCAFSSIMGGMILQHPIDMTPVTCPYRLIEGPDLHHTQQPYIHQRVEVYEFRDIRRPHVKLTATLPQPSLMDLLEDYLKEPDAVDNFRHLKQKKLATLGMWLHNLPYAPAPVQLHSYLGVAPQTCYNTSFWDKWWHGVLEDSKKLVGSTLQRPYLPQCYIEYFDLFTGRKTGHSSGFFFRKNAALTSAHCVYEINPHEVERNGRTVQLPPRKWFKEMITVYPAYNNGKAPLKGYGVKRVFIPKAWVDAEGLRLNDPERYYGDFAVLIFDENIADFTGSLGMAAFANNLSGIGGLLNDHIAHTGGYPGSIGVYDEEDAQNRRGNTRGLRIDDLTYYASLHNIKEIRHNRLIHHEMDIARGQSGGAILPYYPGILHFSDNPYAIGITSHGNRYGNKGILINDEILRWALQVSDPYQIPGESSPYDLTLRQLLDRIQRHMAEEEIMLATAPDSPLNEYHKKWGPLLARFAKRVAPLDIDRALSMHRYNSGLFPHYLSNYYTATLHEKENDFESAFNLYKRAYDQLLKLHNITKYKYDSALETWQRRVDQESKEIVFKLGCYYLGQRNSRENYERSFIGHSSHPLKEAHWLFYLSKFFNHTKGAAALRAFTKVITSKKVSAINVMYNALGYYPTNLIIHRLTAPSSITDILFNSEFDKIESFWGPRGYFDLVQYAWSFPLLEQVRQMPENFNQKASARARILRELTEIPYTDSHVQDSDSYVLAIEEDFFTNAPVYAEPAPAIVEAINEPAPAVLDALVEPVVDVIRPQTPELHVGYLDNERKLHPPHVQDGADEFDEFDDYVHIP